MSDKKPLLSISLLSCGRAKTIRKCLDSLAPLMQKVSSELIIVDTGCSAEIKAMMSEYTDKIIPFTWCDDFSAARNVGMDAAKGEWFLYIDDDEWFIDTKEIEDFFLSGEYKNYVYACYVQRNYTVKSKDLYTDAWVSRMVRLDKNVRFVSCIHEYFYPLKRPYKLVNSIVEHFGYCYESKEEERQHSVRNTKLLLKMIEREKPVMRWWTHLLNEYRAADEFSKIKEVSREGLEYFNNRNDLDSNRERGAFYCALIEAQNMLTEYQDAICEAEKALEDSRITDMCRMRLYNMMAESYYKLENYAESKRCCEEYIKYYDLLKDNPEEIQEQTAFFVMNAFEKAGISSAFCFYIASCLKEGDASALKKYFWTFEWNGVLMLYKTFIADVIDSMAELPYEEVFVQAADTMAKRKGLVTVWDKLLEMEKKYKDAEGEEKEKFYRLARIFSQVKVQNYYIWYLKILYADYIGEAEHMEHYFKRMFHYVADFFCLDSSIFAIAEKYFSDTGMLFETIPFDKWKLGIDSFFGKSDYKVIEERKVFVERTMPEAVSEALALRYDYFFMKAAGADIVFDENKKDFGKLQESFRTYSERCLAFYGQFFKEIAFEGEMALLPAECRVAVRIRELLEAQLSEDREQISQCLKKTVGVFPSFDEAIKAYTRLYADWEKARLEEEQITPEMRALAEQIKGKVQELLAQNLIIEALQVVQQLKTFIPNDPEIAELEKQVSLKLS